MLAEKNFFAELALPKTLSSKARLLSGEYAWAAPDAKDVVQWLLEHNIAVVGVELWQDRSGNARWIATSNYSSEDAPGCAREAQQFINEFQHRESHPDNLFNLIIDSE